MPEWTPGWLAYDEEGPWRHAPANRSGVGSAVTVDDPHTATQTSQQLSPAWWDALASPPSVPLSRRQTRPTMIHPDRSLRLADWIRFRSEQMQRDLTALGERIARRKEEAYDLHQLSRIEERLTR